MTHFDLTNWNAVALEAVRLLHPTPVYNVSRLRRGSPSKVQGQKPRNKSAEAEAKVRAETREINEELSRYYELPEDWTEWGCSDILSRGQHGRGHSLVISLLTCIPSVLRDVETLPIPLKTQLV